MRFVETAAARPFHCVALPQIGQTHRDGYIDFFTELAAPGNYNHRIQVSVVALREAARQFPQVGLVPRDELTLALSEKQAIQKELEDVQAELAECNRELDAIATLRGRGYSQEKRRGRPR